MSLTREKQLALLKLSVATITILVVIWFSLIRSAQTQLSRKSAASAHLSEELSAKKVVLERRAATSAELEKRQSDLNAVEAQMVNGDIYLWIQKTLRDFEIPDQIEFTKYDPPQIIDPDPPLKVPYRLASFAVNGTATYHDLGTFLANFENSYPQIRIRRLEMEPASVDPASKDEKLAFFMELEALIRPKTPAKPRG